MTLRKIMAMMITLVLLGNISVTVFSGKADAAEAIKASPSGIAVSELEGFVDSYVEKYIGKTVAGASITIVKDDNVVLSKGYGYADVENRIAVDAATTVFEWGSISKLFVWTAVMQLAEEGKIRLQEDIRSYLPDGFLTKLRYEEPITMLHLMNHNAGFEDNVFDVCYPSADMVVSLEEGLRLGEPAQIYRPGQVVAYSNYSTSLAAYIVERLTGISFDQYVNEHIFAPLGMGASSIHPFFADNPALPDSKAYGYTLAGEGKFALSDWNYMSLYPSGGINGTAEDLTSFAMALLPREGAASPLFKNPDILTEMLSQSYSASENMLHIAHGFWEFPGEKRGLTHGGNTIAFSSNFHIVPEERFAVIVLTNQEAELDICYGLTSALAGGGTPAASEGNLPDSKALEGAYLSARRSVTGFLSVYPYLGLLHVQATGSNSIRLDITGLTAEYVQTAPYVYEKTGGHVLFDIYRQLYFQVEEGNVVQISASIADYLPLPKGRTAPYLTFYTAAALLCVLYFLVMPVALPVWWRASKRRSRSLAGRTPWPYLAALNLTGTALVANNLALAARMLLKADRGYTEIRGHLWLNYGLTGVGLAAIMFFFILGRKFAFTGRQKLSFGISSVLLVIMVALMVIWRFYS